MQLSARAEILLADYARQQGLDKLAFDENGLISVRLDGRLDIAIGYSPANDSIYLFGIVVERCEESFDPWIAFERNQSLVPKRCRLSLEANGALVLSADHYLEGLSLMAFVDKIDSFVTKLEEEIAAFARPSAGTTTQATAPATGLPEIEGQIIWG